MRFMYALTPGPGLLNITNKQGQLKQSLPHPPPPLVNIVVLHIFLGFAELVKNYSKVFHFYYFVQILLFNLNRLKTLLINCKNLQTKIFNIFDQLMAKIYENCYKVHRFKTNFILLITLQTCHIRPLFVSNIQNTLPIHQSFKR